jgi:hypothetical protein
MTPSVTVADLDSLIEKLAEQEKKSEEHSLAGKDINKELMRLEGQVVAHLKELGREDYLSPLGKVSIKQKWRVNMPADDHAKRLLFEHLRQREIFDKFATVNSNSLNSLFMKDWEAAKERGEGMEFTMPGIEAPKLFEALDFKQKK